ncbi:MAG: PEP-CTERM sorting domain-containing protein [Cyanobacteria bacterium J06635_15]
MASVFFTGVFNFLQAQPAHAFTFGKTGFSTNDGSFDADYVLDALTVSPQGVPNSGSVTDFGITVDPDDANYPLLAPNPSASVSFGTSNLSCGSFSCTSSDGLTLDIGNIADQIGLQLFSNLTGGPNVSELANGLLDTKYIFEFSSQFSADVPTDNSATAEVEGITTAERIAGVSGSLDVFFSKPAGFDSIFSFGKFQYDTKLPNFIADIDGIAGEVIFEEFAPVASTDVPEPSAIFSFLILGVIYGAKRAVKQFH